MENRIDPRPNRHAFTLIELLVVIAVVAVLSAVLLPALASARGLARQTQGLSNLRQMAIGWRTYSIDHDMVLIAGRFAKEPGGTTNPDNHYMLDNGLKYRPRWIATLGLYQGVSAFDNPSTAEDRQDYTSDFFVCPTRPERTDERNSSYGYNLQFLGNARKTHGQYHNYPVLQVRIGKPDHTVMAADSMGTAAGAPDANRTPYDNNGNAMTDLGNHGWSLDPPRLTPNSDRGSGDPGSLRTAVEPRHSGGRANTVFGDGHAKPMTPTELGYRTDDTGAFVNGTPDAHIHDPAEPTNKYFSGDARNTDPPALPTQPQ